MNIKRKYIGLVLAVALAVGVSVYLWNNPLARYPKGEPTASVTPFADDQMVVLEPLPGSVVHSPLRVRGKARGVWFFEASFPLQLTDKNGNVLAQVPAQATQDWMTEGWVEFQATLTFAAQPSGTQGFLILRKDNPSGLPQYDDERKLPVVF